MSAVLSSLEPLVAYLRGQGYTVVGPTESEGAIVLAELSSAGDLRHGWHHQFGESGCGRRIAWCPVGIDITVEAGVLAQEAAMTP